MKKYTFLVENGALAKVIVTVQAPTLEAGRAKAYAALRVKSGRSFHIKTPLGAHVR